MPKNIDGRSTIRHPFAKKVDLLAAHKLRIAPVVIGPCSCGQHIGKAVYHRKPYFRNKWLQKIFDFLHERAD